MLLARRIIPPDPSLFEPSPPELALSLHQIQGHGLAGTEVPQVAAQQLAVSGSKLLQAVQRRLQLLDVLGLPGPEGDLVAELEMGADRHGQLVLVEDDEEVASPPPMTRRSRSALSLINRERAGPIGPEEIVHDEADDVGEPASQVQNVPCLLLVALAASPTSDQTTRFMGRNEMACWSKGIGGSRRSG